MISNLYSKCAQAKCLVYFYFSLTCHLRCFLGYSRYPDLKTYFEYELKSVDTTASTVSFRLCSKNFFSPKPESVEVKYDLLVGADGVNSAVRSEMTQLDSSGTSSPQEYEKSETLEIFKFLTFFLIKLFLEMFLPSLHVHQYLYM